MIWPTLKALLTSERRIISPPQSDPNPITARACHGVSIKQHGDEQHLIEVDALDVPGACDAAPWPAVQQRHRQQRDDRVRQAAFGAPLVGKARITQAAASVPARKKPTLTRVRLRALGPCLASLTGLTATNLGDFGSDQSTASAGARQARSANSCDRPDEVSSTRRTSCSTPRTACSTRRTCLPTWTVLLHSEDFLAGRLAPLGGLLADGRRRSTPRTSCSTRRTCGGCDAPLRGLLAPLGGLAGGCDAPLRGLRVGLDLLHSEDLLGRGATCSTPTTACSTRRTSCSTPTTLPDVSTARRPQASDEVVKPSARAVTTTSDEAPKRRARVFDMRGVPCCVRGSTSRSLEEHQQHDSFSLQKD